MHYGGRQASRGSVMLWAMFCWETLAPATHVTVTLTLTAYLSIVSDHEHSFMETVFPDDCGLVHTYQNNLFFLRLPWHHFKNICVHTDPLKTTQNAVVHIPGLWVVLEIHQKWRRDAACA